MSFQEKPVVYLIDGSSRFTGALSCAQNIARALNGRANVVLVLDVESRIASEAIQGFAAVRRIRIRPLRRGVVDVLLYLPCLLGSSVRLLRYMRNDKATILISNDFYLVHYAICRILGFTGRLITWFRIDPRIFGVASTMWLWIARKYSDHNVSVSKYIRGLLPSGFQSEIIYDSIEVPHVIRDRPIGNRVFVFIGNYIAGKGHDLAIEAFSIVLTQYPDARLEFYGSDMGLIKNKSYRMKLEARSRSIGNSEQTLFGGFVTNTRNVLVGKLAALNLSRSESFSMSVLEASAHGVAVIATKSGGPEEIVEDGRTGFLVPVDDVQALANKMIYLCERRDVAAEMGRAGRKRVISVFSMEAFKERILHAVFPK